MPGGGRQATGQFRVQSEVKGAGRGMEQGNNLEHKIARDNTGMEA